MAINAEELLDAVQDAADGIPTEINKAVENFFETEEEVQALIGDQEAMRTLLESNWTTMQGSAERNYKPGYEWIDYIFGNPSGEPTTEGNPRFIYFNGSETIIRSEYFIRAGKQVIQNQWRILAERNY